VSQSSATSSKTSKGILPLYGIFAILGQILGLFKQLSFIWTAPSV
jgi:hypothetical protein